MKKFQYINYTRKLMSKYSIDYFKHVVLEKEYSIVQDVDYKPNMDCKSSLQNNCANV